MTTIRISATCSLPPERVLHAAYDFTARRIRVWPAVREEHFVVHDQGETSVLTFLTIGCYRDAAPGSINITVSSRGKSRTIRAPNQCEDFHKPQVVHGPGFTLSVDQRARGRASVRFRPALRPGVFRYPFRMTFHGR